SVATLLWTGELAWHACPPAAAARAAVEQVRGVTPLGARLIDRLRLATDVAAISDALRFELTAASVTSCGRALLGVLVDGLPARGRRRPVVALSLPGGPDRRDALAARLWPRLSTATAMAAS